MSDTTLAMAAGYGVIVAGVYAYVGRRVGRRTVSKDARLALTLFSTWWYALAASSLVSASQVLLYQGNALDPQVFAVLGQINLLLIMVALWGLLYYLIYVYTGSKKALLPLSLFYGAFYVVLLFLFPLSAPERLTDDGWSVSAEPAVELSTAAGLILVLVLIGPQILAGVAYFRLYFTVEDRSQRYRIALVSWSIIVWFGLAIVASVAGVGDQVWWQLTSRLLGLAAALTILAAYQPPAWVRRRYGIQGLLERE